VGIDALPKIVAVFEYSGTLADLQSRFATDVLGNLRGAASAEKTGAEKITETASIAQVNPTRWEIYAKFSLDRAIDFRARDFTGYTSSMKALLTNFLRSVGATNIRFRGWGSR